MIDCGLILHYDWLPDAYNYVLKNPTGKRNIEKIYEKVTKSINEADICIIEYTVPNFSSSHQINYSLLRQKPTLVLRLEKDNTFADSYIEAVDSKFLTVKEYNLKNLREILLEFVGINKTEKGLSRYNIVLDNKHKYYLDWASNKYFKSRSEIIRKSIDNSIEKDAEFKKYLKG